MSAISLPSCSYPPAYFSGTHLIIPSAAGIDLFTYATFTYPSLTEEEAEEKYGLKEQDIVSWNIPGNNYHNLLHFLLYKEENKMARYFSQFRSWEVYAELFSGNSSEEFVGRFQLPSEFLGTAFRSRKLFQFLRKTMYLTPVHSTSYIKKATFLFCRDPFPLIHQHAESLDADFGSLAPDFYEGPGAPYFRGAWLKLGKAVNLGMEEFAHALQELLCYYEAFCPPK
ncbi:hypothetical protein HNY73_006686 [Argiope bruennichi]|uniref:Uncharacterized protein n=1 Tax=Argiope bruennichi TaxID=94029 RepID=A0A8T0FH62_ARGBR|nr:hypothetical protein HNY73_006686 [Argiope bruennichi]